MFVCSLSSAQCTIDNVSFTDYESLTYDLYYNWKFIWVKAGLAYFDTSKISYKGVPAYKTYLVTKGNNRLDDYFVLRDTLLAYYGMDVQPLYFRKGAREGKRYTVDEVFFSYVDGESKVRQHYMDRHGKHHWYNRDGGGQCIYDMIGYLQRARNFDAKGWKKGKTIPFLMADGDDIKRCQLRYRGKETYKMDNTGETFRCLVLSFMEFEDEGKKYKEIVRFYVTDDKNHIPVRLDLFLRFGSAKAFLRYYSGVRNPLTARIEAQYDRK